MKIPSRWEKYLTTSFLQLSSDIRDDEACHTLVKALITSDYGSIVLYNIRSGPGVDEVKNDIQKSRLRLLGHVMQMTEEKVHNKMLDTKVDQEDPEPDG